MHPIPSRLNSLSLQTCVFTPFVRFAAAMASSTIPCGSMLVGGVSTMRHASSTPSLIAFAFFAVASDAPRNTTTIGSCFVSSSPFFSPPDLLFIENTGYALVNAVTKLPKSFSSSLATTTRLVFPASPHVLFAISCNPCAPDGSLCLETCVGSAPIAISCTTALALFSLLLLLLLLSPPFLVPVAMTTLDALSFFAPSRNASITDFVFSSMQQFSPFINSTSKTSLSAAGFPTKLRRSNSCLLSSPNNFVAFDDDDDESSSIGISNDRFVFWTEEEDVVVAWYRPPGPPPPPPPDEEEDIILIALKVVVLLLFVFVDKKERPTTQPVVGVFVVTTRERRSIFSREKKRERQKIIEKKNIKTLNVDSFSNPKQQNTRQRRELLVQGPFFLGCLSSLLRLSLYFRRSARNTTTNTTTNSLSFFRAKRREFERGRTPPPLFFFCVFEFSKEQRCATVWTRATLKSIEHHHPKVKHQTRPF